MALALRLLGDELVALEMEIVKLTTSEPAVARCGGAALCAGADERARKLLACAWEPPERGGVLGEGGHSMRSGAPGAGVGEWAASRR